MTNQEIDIIISQLKEYSTTLVAELDVNGIGNLEIEIELKDQQNVNKELLKSILEYVIKNIQSLKQKSQKILNSLASVKEFRNDSEIDFELVGISISNKEIFHNQFKLVFGYDAHLVQQNDDILGYRTVNFSGSKNCFYLSGVNWLY